jgi:quercetin dioxygenase-like cupin family protein
LRLSLSRLEKGVEADAENAVVYDVERAVAELGDGSVAGPALIWRFDPDEADAAGVLLTRTVALDRSSDWIVRCDRIDFALGGVAHRHVHPGPGIRYLLHGEIEIETKGGTTVYRPGEPWFEPGPEPVRARASPHVETSFVRTLVLPAEWAGKRTITYLEPVDDAAPRQSATVFLEHPITLPR